MSSLMVRVAAILLSTAASACSDESPAAPSPSIEPNLIPQTFTPPYTFNLVNTRGQSVASLPVVGVGGSELVLWAQVGGPGVLEQNGTVILQACRNSTGTWRPSAECDSGAAAWTLVDIVKISEITGCGHASGKGNVCRNFGGMPAPITVGFRYRFEPEGGDIPAGVSASKDMTWVTTP